MFNMGSYNSYNLHEDVFVLEKIGMIVTDPRKTLVFYSSTRIKCWKNGDHGRLRGYWGR